MPVLADARPSARRALIALIAAEAISALGSLMSAVALPWFVLATTGSPTRMGLVLAAESAPVLVLAVPSARAVARLGGAGIARRLRRLVGGGDRVDSGAPLRRRTVVRHAARACVPRRRAVGGARRLAGRGRRRGARRGRARGRAGQRAPADAEPAGLLRRPGARRGAARGGRRPRGPADRRGTFVVS